MHEVITLQLGQRANYLATHFWNTQESYFTYAGEEESPVDHDILFRPGIGADGTDTFTPRTLIYDLKGGFGNLRKINALYELEEERNGMPQGLWNGPAVVQRQPAIEQNPYQLSLDAGLEPPPLTTSSVRYWSDFNRVYFHPKSIVQLNEYELNSSLVPFEKWDAGEELFDSLDKEHDLLDRDVRSFAEEADQMQGLQIFTSVDDAWGGFAARYVDRLRDEYGKTAIWVWGMEDSLRNIPRVQQTIKLSNSARTLSSISSQASLYIPLSPPSTLPPYITLDRNSPWHVSALFSTAIESVTLPSRLKSTSNRSRETLDTLAAALNINGKQNIAKLQMSITPDFEVSNGTQERNGDSRLPTQERSRMNGNGSDSHMSEDEDPDANPHRIPPLDIDFFPYVPTSNTRPSAHVQSKNLHTFGQAEAYRGAPNDIAPPDSQNEYDGHSRAQRRAADLPIIHHYAPTPLAYPLLSSFPSSIFTFNHDPDALDHEKEISVKARLTTDTEVGGWIKGLREVVVRGSVLGGIGVEDREVLGNSLGEIGEGFVGGWDEDGDGSSDDDD